MPAYLNGVILLSLLVDFLLLLGAARLCGCPVRIGGAFLGALLGGLHAGACLLPGFHFLGNFLWRVVSFGVISMLAYGLSLYTLRKGLVFGLLHLALGGVVHGIGKVGMIGTVFGAGILYLVCSFGFRGTIGGRTFIPIELSYGKKRLRLTALQDTGNTLRDPITGRQVLVIGADAAGELTGLTPQQLRTPVESIGALPGLRLVPYHTIDSTGGFLLAMRLQNVKIGAWQGNTLVAFAPEGLSTKGEYQALTGGVA